MKGSSYLTESLLDPKTAMSQEPNEVALNLAFKTDLPIWEWFEAKGNEHRLLRFGIAMEGGKRAASLTAILEGIDLVSDNVPSLISSTLRNRLRLEDPQRGCACCGRWRRTRNPVLDDRPKQLSSTIHRPRP